MLYALIMLQIADVATTVYALQQPGFREVNPVVRWLQDKLGLVLGTMILKFAFIAALFVAHQAGQLNEGFLLAAVIAYVLVVGNNLRQLIPLWRK
jgi:hypothetical protein